MVLRTVGMLSVVGATSLVAAQAPTPGFAVVSIKQTSDQRVRPPVPGFPGGRFYRANATVVELVQFAYGMMDFQIVGGPDWIRRDRFEIDARTGSVAPGDAVGRMVQSVLEDRFGLVARREEREMEHAVLRVARASGGTGPGLTPCEDPENIPPARPVRVSPGGIPRPAGVNP